MTSTQRAPRWNWHDDRGGVSVFVAIIAVPLLFLGGLFAVDAFGVTRAHERADGVATEAARAAAQAIDPTQAITGNAIVADPQDAAAAARAYLNAAGVTGTVTVSGDGHRITVQVTDTYTGKFAPNTWTVNATSSASLLHGITQPEKD
ncbi:Flp pilus assembly protein TadG [Streptomyces sp. V4I8]|jgi:Flp pilus assembly protein TadG|uniref:pilus assembly protein TadG-related protein n=1 Tax=Streptomyces sp. V4I8 TaxID=3156469 RepID=UPI003519A65D